MPRPKADTVLLLIDLQRAFCDPDGSMAAQGRDIVAMQSAAKVCAKLAAAARSHHIPVIWTRLVYREDYLDGGRLMWELRPNLLRIGALRAQSSDCEMSMFAGHLDHDVLIDKPRYSALYSTPLEALLRALSTGRILVGGVTTSMCVESTVRDLAQRDYEMIVVGDACGDFDQARHEASLAALAFGFAPVLGSAEAMTMLGGRPHAA